MKGFTLVETLLAGLLSLMVGIFLVGILANQSGFFYKQNSIIDQGVSTNSALAAITSKIRESSVVAVGYPEQLPHTFTSEASTLVLKLPATNSTGTIDGLSDFVVIAADSNNPHILRLRVYPNPQSTRPAADNVLATNLSSVSFVFLDKGGNVVTPTSSFQVQTTLSIESSTGSIRSERSATVSTSLRNSSP